jgi:signal transduction histidine kinase
MTFWYTLSQTGINPDAQWQTNRQIILCNTASLIVSGFVMIISILSLINFGWIVAVQLSWASSLLFLLPIILNKYGWANASRLFLIGSINLGALFISIADKFDAPLHMEEFQYFHLRAILLGCTLLPFVLFDLEEKKYWIPAVIVNLLCLLLFDPAHALFGVGYYQVGFTSPNYYFLNYICIAAALILVACSYFLKFSYETIERKKEKLITSLNKANEIIQRQRELLAHENNELNLNLIEKNNQLIQTNEELIQHNNDLQQFSYTVSHNLRGPVASMMGLLDLLKPDDWESERAAIVQYIRKSVISLDSTITDLNTIIDIRNRVTRIRQAVDLNEEIDHVIGLLQKDLHDHRVQIEREMNDVSIIYSIKPMIGSILYNLVSNAIKYRSPERNPLIRIRVHQKEDIVTIEVSDNGLGLDVHRFKDKIFGLYKRFHTHTDGKGIGLFLVKLQAETLGGGVDIFSTPEQGTTFVVSLRSVAPEQDEKSILPLPDESNGFPQSKGAV